MKIRPILFSTPMVQAILEGTKNQTRRIVKNNNSLYASKFSELDFNDAFVEGFNLSDKCLKAKHLLNDTRQLILSKIETGDIFWVRETWQYSDDLEHPYLYKQKELGEWLPEYFKRMKWKPSIFMPKEACRNFLEVTNVRVEKLNDITEEDAKSEGIKVYKLEEEYHDYNGSGCGCYATAKGSFFSLWNSINGKNSWKANPWVWVYDFKRVEKPENF